MQTKSVRDKLIFKIAENVAFQACELKESYSHPEPEDFLEAINTAIPYRLEDLEKAIDDSDETLKNIPHPSKGTIDTLMETFDIPKNVRLTETIKYVLEQRRSFRKWLDKEIKDAQYGYRLRLLLEIKEKLCGESIGTVKEVPK